jgi:hypothetical protein
MISEKAKTKRSCEQIPANFYQQMHCQYCIGIGSLAGAANMPCFHHGGEEL